MDVKEAAPTTTNPSADVSGPRALGVFIASVISYGIGYYIAIAILFSMFGLDSASDAPWKLTTIGLGSVLGGTAASVTSPKPGWAPLFTAIGIAVAALVIGLIVDIGFEFGIGTGVVVALGAALTAYALEAR